MKNFCCCDFCYSDSCKKILDSTPAFALAMYFICNIIYVGVGSHILLTTDNNLNMYYGIYEYNVVMIVMTCFYSVVFVPLCLKEKGYVTYGCEGVFNYIKEIPSVVFFPKLKSFFVIIIYNIAMIIYGIYIIIKLNNSQSALDYYSTRQELVTLFIVGFAVKIITTIIHFITSFFGFVIRASLGAPL
jgi:hypothetical protein